MSTTMGKAESTWGGGGEFSDFGFLKKENIGCVCVNIVYIFFHTRSKNVLISKQNLNFIYLLFFMRDIYYL